MQINSYKRFSLTNEQQVPIEKILFDFATQTLFEKTLTHLVILFAFLLFF